MRGGILCLLRFFLSFSAHSDSLEKSIQDDTEEVNENDLKFNGL